MAKTEITTAGKAAGHLQWTHTKTTISSERLGLALDANWEIAALAAALRGVVTPDEDQEWLVVRGLAARIEDLCGVIGSAIDDSGMSNAELVRNLRND
jgi:hypothetical protein